MIGALDISLLDFWLIQPKEYPIKDADFGKTAEDYLTHRAGFPNSLFERFNQLALIQSGQRVLDLGTGTGTLGRGFAVRDCQVTGLDPSAEMIEAAKTIDADQGLNTSYVIAPSEKTGLPDNSFELVTAGQCWHWFDAEATSIEIQRLLVPGGKLIVAYYDWLPLNGNMVRRTEELIESYNPAWRAGNLTGIHPGLFRDLGENGFRNIESFTYDEPAVYTHESWRGRIRASAGVAATLSDEETARFDAELAKLLKKDFPESPTEVPHRVFAVIADQPE